MIRPWLAGWLPDWRTREVEAEGTAPPACPGAGREGLDAGIDSETVASTRDRHQPLHLGPAESNTRELGIDQLELLAVKVELAQQRLDRLTLIRRQLLLGEPGSALDAEQVRGRTPGHEVSVQDRLDLVLQPGALTHDVRAPRDLPAKRMRLLVGEPHAGQEVRREQSRQHLRVDLVRLDLCLGDHPRLRRVRDDHPANPLLEQPRDRDRVARRFDRDLVMLTQAVREQPQRLRGRRDPAASRLSLLEIATSAKSWWTSDKCSVILAPSNQRLTWELRRANDTYGSALEAHPGQS